MVVYLDVLVFTNLFVNYFILKITSYFCHDAPKTLRIVFGSLTGAVFSLYIFLPPAGIALESLIKIICSAAIILITFGFTSVKSFFRRIGIFFGTSFLYAGFMLAIWAIIKPQNLAINNGIVYINISPLILITATLLGYIVISLIRYFSSKQAYLGKRCKIRLFLKDKKAEATALIDTGHSLTDGMTGSSVIIIEENIAKRLFEILPTPELTQSAEGVKGFRLIPYSTVGGEGLLTAFRPEKIEIEYEGKIKILTEPIVAISKTRLGEDYKSIISPSLL